MANLNSIGSRNYLHLEPTADEEKTIRDQAIKDVALGCFLELAVSSALAAFCCCFVATPAAVATIANGLAIQTLASFVMRCHVG